MRLPRRISRRIAVVLALVCWFPVVGQPVDHEQQRREMQDEIARLQSDLERLAGKELGLLGQLERLGAELRLHQAELDEATLRLEGLNAQIDEFDRTLEKLDEAQQLRRNYLGFRLREVYKAGPDQALARLVGGAEADRYLEGLTYASYLSERDGEVLAAFRADSERAREERRLLIQTQAELVVTEGEAADARDRLEASRKRRVRSLRAVRRDQTQRRAAIGELETAARELSELVDAVPLGSGGLDVHKFKGLLEWPVQGTLSAGFGTVVHPQFRTRIPHPGWDIDAEYAASIRCVFEGQVVFSDWMRGYGLTVIVDHGGGLMSIYAHASALVAETGEEVQGGQLLGMVGDTGSLRGTYLYFELRVDGRPVDPTNWLRQR